MTERKRQFLLSLIRNKGKCSESIDYHYFSCWEVEDQNKNCPVADGCRDAGTTCEKAIERYIEIYGEIDLVEELL